MRLMNSSVCVCVCARVRACVCVCVCVYLAFESDRFRDNPYAWYALRIKKGRAWSRTLGCRLWTA